MMTKVVPVAGLKPLSSETDSVPASVTPTTDAQQRERIRRIGVLMPYAADEPEAQARIGAYGAHLQPTRDDAVDAIAGISVGRTRSGSAPSRRRAARDQHRGRGDHGVSEHATRSGCIA